MPSIASNSQSNPHDASYAGTGDWMRCFELLGHGELNPDEAITQASQGHCNRSAALDDAPGSWLVDEQAL